jgi:hypothetical protein
VLFSRDDVASFINRNFEPVWQTVRPVPLVHIDFGNGLQLTRTLHGNIATYVCAPDGQVLDTLAGIYTPTVYLDRLNQFRLLANYVDQLGPEKRGARLRDYHKFQAEALSKNAVPPVLINVAPISKAAIERGLKAVLVPANDRLLALHNASPKNMAKGNPSLSPEDLASWKALAEDTEVNETIRRRQIHEQLAARGLILPHDVTKWLYKNVLHADLDDPYLGLGSTLFADYPFKDKVQ